MTASFKSKNTLNNQALDFVHYLKEHGVIENNAKKELFDTFDIDSGLAKIISWLSNKENNLLLSKKDIIQKIATMDNDTLSRLKKIRLRDAQPQSFYETEIHNMFGEDVSGNNMGNLISAYRLYQKYKEFLTKQQVNKTNRRHTLKYNTAIQSLKHRRINKKGESGTGDYFLDTNEQFIRMKQDENKNKQKLAITKSFGPLRISMRQVTDNSVQDIKHINSFNPDKEPIELKTGDYIIKFNIGAHDFQGGKAIQDAYGKLAEYLKSEIYEDIIYNNKMKGIETKREDIHIAFIFGISVLQTFGKKGGWNIRKMPLQMIKKTDTYMYGLFNPHGKYTEEPAFQRFTNPETYKKLKKMTDKYDARDISFMYTSPAEFIKKSKDL